MSKIAVRKIGARWQPVDNAGHVVRGDVYNADGTGYSTKEGAQEAAEMLRLSRTGGRSRAHHAREAFETDAERVARVNAWPVAYAAGWLDGQTQAKHGQRRDPSLQTATDDYARGYSCGYSDYEKASQGHRSHSTKKTASARAQFYSLYSDDDGVALFRQRKEAEKTRRAWLDAGATGVSEIFEHPGAMPSRQTPLYALHSDDDGVVLFDRREDAERTRAAWLDAGANDVSDVFAV
jgi:hypothetical protein